jgi:hypothetical protein
MNIFKRIANSKDPTVNKRIGKLIVTDNVERADLARAFKGIRFNEAYRYKAIPLWQTVYVGSSPLFDMTSIYSALPDYSIIVTRAYGEADIFQVERHDIHNDHTLIVDGIDPSSLYSAVYFDPAADMIDYSVSSNSNLKAKCDTCGSIKDVEPSFNDEVHCNIIYMSCLECRDEAHEHE